ncbi:Bug family tripartite tricarboxylate transporter substrate binding protein [Ramlibacter albus]|uniref:Tripartite tricarboxylate transporter substrate binding protein n=1 Tax=Ramlibacter albus TaxID=2079448 RepID=A0A923M679_9BURK|nr:tripartite tricarboxylate transporter substrate binding protein [Ramlibacter albus]MBC5764551.1 tripartite tricarboxylate transporter substrate binding protein [Ramlibacter albus]
MQRRTFLAAAAATSSWAALAQSAFPNRPLTFVVPFAAGGGGDVVARMLAKELGDRIKQPIVVENRVGAGGNIGSAYVLKSKPDGYTLLNMSSTYPIQAALTKVPFDPIGDMQPIIMVSRDPAVVVVNTNSPLKNAKDLAQAAKDKPGKLSYGSAGVGSIAHVGMEELAFNMGVQMTHVPYKGSSQAFNDVMSGQVDMMLTSATYASPFIRSGRVRALGVASAQRMASMPDVPTFAEQGWPDYLLVDWKAVAAPKGVPPEVVAFLNRELNEVLRSRNVSEKFTAEGTTAVGGTPEQMMDIVRSDVERWRALAKRANLKIE